MDQLKLLIIDRNSTNRCNSTRHDSENKLACQTKTEKCMVHEFGDSLKLICVEAGKWMLLR